MRIRGQSKGFDSEGFYVYYYARPGHNSAPFWLNRLGVINDCLAVKHDIALIYNELQANGGTKKRGAKGNGS